MVGLRGFSSNPREAVSKVWSLTAFPAERVKTSHPNGGSFIPWFWGWNARYCQDGPQEQFGDLDSYIASMSFRSLIFSMLGTGPRYRQDDAQDPHFEDFGALAPDIARMGLRMLF